MFLQLKQTRALCVWYITTCRLLGQDPYTKCNCDLAEHRLVGDTVINTNGSAQSACHSYGVRHCTSQVLRCLSQLGA